ncbi:hypothetical protein GTP44_01075 [Duganella sp. FT50W]|uniref:Uncharacterized protein n=1 Tax=Duganella lactea TaxID=2692173 RepID=A0A6L8MFL7_9BURK|nr:hypothetical protein [Duganella lactea]MYM80552.1 hypothetical protein [Duganella lactea]
MQISNDELARILGRIEAKLDAHGVGLANLEQKVTRRLDEHDQRLREVEIANPKKLADSIKDHEQRIQALEKGAAKAGVLAGVGTSVVVGALIEFIRRQIGH